MIGRTCLGCLTALLLASAGIGCNLLNSSTSPDPSTMATSSTFSGTVGLLGTSVVSFTTTAAGPVGLTLTSLSPSPPVGIGLGLGTPNGNSGCTLASFTTSATAASTPQITVTENAGTYCVQVYDPGTLTATTSFSVSVSHS